MSTKIRLARAGAKKRPFYRIIVADQRAPRDGRFIEKLGTYNPNLPKDDANRVVYDKERMAHWLKVGAQPTERVTRFLRAAGVIKGAAVYRNEETGPKNPDKLRKNKPAEVVAEAPAAPAPAAEAAPAVEAAAPEATPAGQDAVVGAEEAASTSTDA